MKVEDKLLQRKEAVERELESILSEEDSVLFQAMRHTVLSGGKRFRPLLVLCSGAVFGVPENTLLPYACAVELIHNYSLIHDDLPSMDNDDFRRGKPSCHKAFGEDIALLTGDSLLTLAFEVLAKASSLPDSYPQKEKVMSAICQLAGVKGMIKGQLLDITLTPEKMTEEILHDLILKKTGSLIVASVKAGALLGQALPFQLEAIVEYGKNIGLAFQIRDDILDSVEKKKKNSLFRPNYVAFFGLEEARRRLTGFVGAGIKALDEASLESEELGFLAFRLQD
jgi:geranylgeranyl diphosphate synthase type II